MKKFLKRMFAGMAIGVGAAIPGVSGAAVALIFLIYEDLINAINSFRKHIKQSIIVLLPILLGVILAVIPCIYIGILSVRRIPGRLQTPSGPGDSHQIHPPASDAGTVHKTGHKQSRTRTSGRLLCRQDVCNAKISVQDCKGGERTLCPRLAG